MGPAVLVLDLDPVPEISALVPVGLAVRSYPNSPFAWPSLVRIAPSRQPRSLGGPVMIFRGSSTRIAVWRIIRPAAATIRN